MAYHILKDNTPWDYMNLHDNDALKMEDGPGWSSNYHGEEKFNLDDGERGTPLSIQEGPGWSAELQGGEGGWNFDPPEGSALFGPPDGWRFQDVPGWSLHNHGEEEMTLNDGERGKNFYGPPKGDGYVVLSPGEQGMPILH